MATFTLVDLGPSRVCAVKQLSTLQVHVPGCIFLMNHLCLLLSRAQHRQNVRQNGEKDRGMGNGSQEFRDEHCINECLD
jgi:hypothetical protein